MHFFRSLEGLESATTTCKRGCALKDEDEFLPQVAKR